MPSWSARRRHRRRPRSSAAPPPTPPPPPSRRPAQRWPACCGSSTGRSVRDRRGDPAEPFRHKRLPRLQEVPQHPLRLRRVEPPLGSRSRSPRTTGSSGAACAGGRISSIDDGVQDAAQRVAPEGRLTAQGRAQQRTQRPQVGLGPGRCRPDIRSGAVYSGEPTKDPVSVSVVAPATWAMPKSVRTTRPVPSSRSTFAGLMSRCRTPAACAVRSAPSRAMPIRAASAASTGPRPRDPVGERAAVDQLHDDVRAFVVLDDVVHDDDVRVAQLGDRARLAQGAVAPQPGLGRRRA